MSIANKFLSKNSILFMKHCIVIGEHIIIESGNLFFKMHSIKAEQSFKMPQGKIKLEET